MIRYNTIQINNLKKVFILFASLLFISCEKEISIELENSEPKLVVEGVIETGQYAYLTLSKSTAYFGSVDSNTFQNMFITDALVIVSDGIEYDTLVFDTVPFYPPFRFQGSKIKGKEKHSYSLKIIYNKQEYTSSTTIPTTIPIDSIKYQYRADSDSLGMLRFYANDPISEINYYKVFSLDLDIDLTKEIPTWVHPARAVVNDKFFNGKLVEATIYKGWNPLKGSAYYEYHKEDWWAFKIGDRTLIKLSSIDYQSYIFWRTTEDVIYNADNPFAAPTTVQTNIYPNALGSWCGYASSIVEVTISKDMILETKK